VPGIELCEGMFKMRILFTFIIVMLISPVYGQIRLQEDFSTAHGRTPPASWESVLVKGSSLDRWNFDDPYVVSPLSSASSGNFGTFAGFFYSDDGTDEESELVSPVFNCSADQVVTLFFYEYFYNDDGEGGAQVLVSSDNGVTWQVAYEPAEKESPALPVLRKIDISSRVAGKNHVRLKLRAFGSGTVAWIVDDISVIAGPVTPPVIEHTPLLSTCSTGPFSISAIITSDLGISSAVIHYKINGQEQQQITMAKESDNLFKGEMPRLLLNGKVEYNIEAVDASINRNSAFDTGDQQKFNTFYFGGINSGEFIENFEDETSGQYAVLDKDQLFAWQLTQHFSENSLSLFLNFYETREKGLRSTFQTIPIVIDQNKNALTFDLAYAQYRNNSDILNVNLSQDGGETWKVVSGRSGYTLQTTSPSDPPFFPQATEWTKKFINLSKYTGECVLISFTGISNDGNNLFIDDIHFEEIPESKLSVSQNYPNPVPDGHTKISINLPDLRPGEFLIYDMMGREKMRHALEPTIGAFLFEINVSQLSSGAYLYRVISDRLSVSKRMVID
jgi:hypothetical protein